MESDDTTANQEGALYPPLRIWKLAILMIATVSLYQFVWLYRTAKELRSTRDPSIVPWHWALAPLLGPFAAVVGHYLATHLQAWREEENSELGHFAEPILLAMSMAIAYLPLMFIVIEMTAVGPLMLVVALMLCVPYLILQHQLNLIKAVNPDTAFVSPSWLFTRNQVVTLVTGGVLAAPLYVLGFSEAWEKRSATGLLPNSVISPEDVFFQIRIKDTNWSQVDTGYLSDESDVEFLGPDQWTWAVVYDSTDLTVDEVLSYRIDAIRSEHRKARCEQNKTLIKESFVVRGELHCNGRDAVNGQYTYESRILAEESKVVEIVGYTAQHGSQAYKDMSARVRKFVDGLEIVE